MNRLPSPARSARAEVRNPVLGMRAFQKFATLHPAVLDALADLLQEMHVEAAARAEQCWRTRKAPMAVYWRAVSVYAGHIRRAIRRLPRTDPDQLALVRHAA